MRRKKPRETVYLRDYPIDYELYRKTGDFSYIHPNKLRTWLEFSKAAASARGKKFEDVIDSVVSRLKGRRFKPEERRIVYLPREEIVKLKIDAMSRGIDPRWIDILAKPIEEKPIEEKRWVKVLAKAYTEQ